MNPGPKLHHRYNHRFTSLHVKPPTSSQIKFYVPPSSIKTFKCFMFFYYVIVCFGYIYFNSFHINFTICFKQFALLLLKEFMIRKWEHQNHKKSCCIIFPKMHKYDVKVQIAAIFNAMKYFYNCIAFNSLHSSNAIYL